MTYEERKELNDLSKEVFGTSSRWRKLLDRGDHRDAVYEERKNLKHKPKSVTTLKQFTHETVKAYMLELREQTTKRLEEIKANEALRQTAD